MNALELFLRNMDWSGLGDFLLSMAAILLCLTVHEASHALAAYLLGDPTAKRHDRISLNPLRHLDPLGALMMLVAGFGWARPVPVDPRYFRHPKAGMAVTALAGPLSNLVLAYLALLLRAALFPLYQLGSSAAGGLCDFLVTLALLSIGLGLFNLIPIPPLDGSKVLEGALRDKLYYTLLRYERWGSLLLMVLLWSGVIDGPLWAARNWVLNGMVEGTMWLYRLVWRFF